MLGIVCGGQGQLTSGMFALTAAEDEAQPIFRLAEEMLNIPLFQTEMEPMGFDNRSSQIATVATGLAVHAAIGTVLPAEFAVAGYSVGEMAAWSIAGVWTAAECLRLTALRAEIMSAAEKDGALAFIRGIEANRLRGLLESSDCYVAISNPGGLYIVGGRRKCLECFVHRAGEWGYRSGLLNIAVPSHTPLLRKAVTPFLAVLESADAQPILPGVRLVSATTGDRIFDAPSGRNDLARQLAESIDWEAALTGMVELGVTRFLDLGPGRAMTEIILAMDSSFSCQPATGFRSMEGLKRWIASD